MDMEATLSQIQQGALNTDQSVSNSALAAALQSLADPKTFNPVFAFDLVNNLAQFSPDIREKLGNELYQADRDVVLNNPAQVARLQQICKQLAQTSTQQQLATDSAKLKDAAQQQMLESKTKHAQEWRDYMENVRQNKKSPQTRAIEEEINDAIEKGVSGRRDKGMFDPLSLIGHMYELLLQYQFIVPLDARLYSKGFFKYVPPAENEYVKQLSAEHGNTTVFPDPPRP